MRGQGTSTSPVSQGQSQGWGSGGGLLAHGVPHSPNWISEKLLSSPTPGQPGSSIKAALSISPGERIGTEQQGADIHPGDSQNGPGRAGTQGGSYREAGGDTVRGEEAGAGSLLPNSAFHDCVTLGRFLGLSVPQMGILIGSTQDRGGVLENPK